MKLNILTLIILIPLLIGCGKKDKLKVDTIDPLISKNRVYIDETSHHKEINIEKFKILEFLEDKRSFAYPSLEIVNDSDILLFATMSENRLEDFNHGRIISCISKDQGKTWINFKIKELNFPGSINVYGPSVKRIKNGDLLLIYGVKYSASRSDVYFEISKDEGLTWSNPKIINKSNIGYQILNNHRIELTKSGRIIIPISYPKNGDFNSYWNTGKGLIAFYYYSDDNGQTWQKSLGITSSIAIFEPGIVNISNNELLMNIRTDIGKVLFARSYDNGINWEYEESNINSPSSPQTLFMLQDNLLMVWNNNIGLNLDHGGNRSPLNLAFSNDRGRSWNSIIQIEKKDTNYDYAYSGIMNDNKYLYIVYNERINYQHKLSMIIARIAISDLKIIK